MKNTENQRIGLMKNNQEFMKRFKMYKKHSNQLKQIKEAFEKEGHKFNNMNDIDNILMLLKGDPSDICFLDDEDDNILNTKEKKPNIFDNPFFKPF